MLEKKKELSSKTQGTHLVYFIKLKGNQINVNNNRLERAFACYPLLSKVKNYPGGYVYGLKQSG